MTSKIKILHIIKSLGRGGAEMLLPETLRLHDKNKFEFHYIYFLTWKDQMVKEIEQAGGVVKCMPSNNNIQLLNKYRDIIDYCRKNRINIVHCHLPWAGFVGRMVFKKTGIPTFYSEHNLQDRYHPITKIINKITFNNQTMVFGVSQDVTDSINRSIAPKTRVETLLNGVNTKKFIRKGDISIRHVYKIPQDAIVFGNIAVFRFQKRLKEWLQNFKKIADANSKVFGIIVGAGPLEIEVKDELEKLNLKDRVFLPGLQTNVKPYYEAIDIFMMTSSFEGLPIALLEAMSMECAIISTNAGGIKEVIRNEKDGLLCDVKEWRRLVDYGIDLAKDPGKLSYLKRSARERVIESFSLERMVSELEKYYLSEARSLDKKIN